MIAVRCGVQLLLSLVLIYYIWINYGDNACLLGMIAILLSYSAGVKMGAVVNDPTL